MCVCVYLVDKESGLEKEGKPVDYMAVEEDMQMIGQEEGKEMEDMLLNLGDIVQLR